MDTNNNRSCCRKRTARNKRKTFESLRSRPIRMKDMFAPPSSSIIASMIASYAETATRKASKLFHRASWLTNKYTLWTAAFESNSNVQKIKKPPLISCLYGMSPRSRSNISCMSRLETTQMKIVFRTMIAGNT